jgi:hypothetical protein
MQNYGKKALIIATLCGFLAGGFSTTLINGPKAEAVSLGNIFGKVIKTGGIAYLVDRYAVDLNNFINRLTAKHGITNEYATKVVPIIAIGSDSYVGAAQVSGPQSKVDECQSALALEGEFLNSTFRVQALIPIDSKNPTSFNRVQGVGVSAKIDVKI